MINPPSLKERFRGILLGTAVGDALGLPAEGLSRRRTAKMFRGRWRHRFLVNSGMTSDDTDHTVFVTQGLLKYPGSPELFARKFAWSLRWWLLALPAGTGLATLRSTLRLWLGFSPSLSGVYSAGNGPAMRAAPIGAFFSSDRDMLDRYIEASTIITHTDPRALTGAKAVAYITAWCIRDNLLERPSPEDFYTILKRAGSDDEWIRIVHSIEQAVKLNWSVAHYSESIGLQKGITGYIYHTVPVAVYSWYRHFGNFEISLLSVLNCGGDTDTVGAIVGALAGAAVGDRGIPLEWIDGIREWPRGITFLTKLSGILADCSIVHTPCSTVRYFWPGVIVRNLFFLVVVLLHGLRRLVPPY